MVLEVSTNAGHDLVPAARDKLDLRVAKQNVNLCQPTVAGTVAAATNPGTSGAIVPLLGMRLVPGSLVSTVALQGFGCWVAR
jgi:hypothetical protein